MCILEGVRLGHALKQKYPPRSSFLSFLCFILLFWVSHDYERLTYPLLGAWVPKTLWCNKFYCPFNVIPILLFLFSVYWFVYGLITHIHLCYRILIIGKYFYPKSLKELLGNSCLRIEWCYLALLCIISLKANYLV